MPGRYLGSDERALGRAAALRVAGEFASRQHGVVSRQQLRNRGVTDRVVDRLIECAGLRPVHRGVYLVGQGAAPALASEAAALLVCGPTAVLSHRSAAWLWRLMDRAPPRVEVTVSPEIRRRQPGIRSHRTAKLERRDVRVRNGLLVTAPERTLLDLAAVAGRAELVRAVDAARGRRLLRKRRLAELVDSSFGRRGIERLRLLLAVPGFSRSEAERLLLALIARAGLPAPQRNVEVEGYEVDLWWPKQRVVVEIDGYEFHSDREAFEADRRRDSTLAASGIRTVRITWRRITAEPEAVVVQLARVLESASWRPTSQSSRR